MCVCDSVNDNNCPPLLGLKSWFFLINIIDEKSSADADIQAMAMSLINKVRESQSLAYV